MALQDILAAIERDGEREVAATLAEAEREAASILARAREEASRRAAEVEGAAAAELEAEEERILREARLRATRLLREAREEVYRAALAEARRRLAGVRARPCYPAILRALLEEALAALPEAEVVVADARDAEAFAGAAGGRSVRPALETWGGVEVATGDGRLVRNTLEERLARAEPFLRALVASRIPGMAPEALEDDRPPEVEGRA